MRHRLPSHQAMKTSQTSSATSVRNKLVSSSLICSKSNPFESNEVFDPHLCLSCLIFFNAFISFNLFLVQSTHLICLLADINFTTWFQNRLFFISLFLNVVVL